MEVHRNTSALIWTINHIRGLTWLCLGSESQNWVCLVSPERFFDAGEIKRLNIVEWTDVF